MTSTLTKSSIETLFETFSANLAIYFPEHQGKFMCPLCLGLFERPTPSTRHLLSRAHIWPESLGGRDFTLACKTCNNRIGTEIEVHLTTLSTHNEAVNGDGRIKRVRLQLQGDDGSTLGTLTTEMHMKDERDALNVILSLVPSASNPADIERIKSAIASSSTDGASPINFRISYSAKLHPNRIRLAYLHSAYLWMFHQFGYEWLSVPAAQQIREQLQQPHHIFLNPKILGLTNVLDIPARELGLYIIREPKEFAGFAVLLPQSSNKNERPGVWLPLFGREYSFTAETPSAKLRMFKLQTTHHLLSSPGERGVGHFLVRQCFSETP
jgi:hypothetical protein